MMRLLRCWLESHGKDEVSAIHKDWEFCCLVLMTVTKSHNLLPAFLVLTCEQGLFSEGGQRRSNMRRMMTVMFATPTAEASAMTVWRGQRSTMHMFHSLQVCVFHLLSKVLLLVLFIFSDGEWNPAQNCPAMNGYCMQMLLLHVMDNQMMLATRLPIRNWAQHTVLWLVCTRFLARNITR